MKLPFGKKKSEGSNLAPVGDRLIAEDALRAVGKAIENRPLDKFAALSAFLGGIPGVTVLGKGDAKIGQGWWVKLHIDVDRPHAWNIVQELGHILNDMSATDRLPTAFKPVSEAPFRTGGPSGHLNWLLQCWIEDQDPELVMKWLESRLPHPASDAATWEGLER